MEFSEGGGVSGYTQETRDTPYVLIVFLIVSFLRVVNILSILRHYIVFQVKRKNSRPLCRGIQNLSVFATRLAAQSFAFFPEQTAESWSLLCGCTFFLQKKTSI